MCTVPFFLNLWEVMGGCVAELSALPTRILLDALVKNNSSPPLLPRVSLNAYQ